MQKVLSLLFTIAFLVLAWMTYDNVYRDLEPTKALAEAAACKVKDCKKRHGFTKITRLPTGIDVEYGWEEKHAESTILVKCHRESYVFGPMQCVAQ